MQHPPGNEPSNSDRTRLRGDLEHVMAQQRTHQAGDTEADNGATEFLESLQEALLTLETRAPAACFEHATRKADHLEALRRTLGLLLDLLADWEMVTERK